MKSELQNYLQGTRALMLAHHAGHADIIRELIDGQGGKDADLLDETGWTEYYTTIQRAAETFLDG